MSDTIERHHSQVEDIAKQITRVVPNLDDLKFFFSF